MHRNGLFLLLAITTVFVACGDDESTESAVAVEPTPTSHQTQPDVQPVPGRSQYDPVSPDILPLPAHMAFDPCSLFSSEFAESLNIPMNQRIERVGGTRKIPEDHRYTPYVGCIWRSVVQGVPRLAVDIQQAAENLEVNGDSLAAPGDAAWFKERNGHSELRMHLGDYVVFIRAELPNNNQLNSKQVHEAIANHLVKVFKALPEGSRVPLDAGIFGGPKVNICEVAKASGLADLLPGPNVWAFPTGAINHVPDERNPKPDADYVGCTFAGTDRGSVQVRFLGPHGIKRQLGLYNTQTPITIGEINGFRKRNGIYLSFGEGAFELSETMTPFDDELLPQKLENIMQTIIETVNE